MDIRERVREWLGERFNRRHLPLMAVGGLSAVLGVILGMRIFFAPRAQLVYLRVETGKDLMALATLQKRHHIQYGAYANDFEALARISGDPKGLRDSLAEHLDLETLMVSGTSTQFLLEANVLDPQRTLMGLKGPPDGNVP